VTDLARYRLIARDSGMGLADVKRAMDLIGKRQ
jgi:hypothetical protein